MQFELTGSDQRTIIMALAAHQQAIAELLSKLAPRPTTTAQTAQTDQGGVKTGGGGKDAGGR